MDRQINAAVVPTKLFEFRPGTAPRNHAGEVSGMAECSAGSGVIFGAEAVLRLVGLTQQHGGAQSGQDSTIRSGVAKWGRLWKENI